MKKKRPSLQGNIPSIVEQQIYLNVNALEDGEYELKIIHKNKIIKTTIFKKVSI